MLRVIRESPLGSGTYAARPITGSTDIVNWKGVLPPAAGGTVTSGTGFVDTLDEFDLYVLS